MDKRTYVTRLKKMLGLYADSSCSHCPVSPYYTATLTEIPESDCLLCQHFVGLEYWELGYRGVCPCYRPNSEQAVKRALKHIALYEERHGEISI